MAGYTKKEAVDELEGELDEDKDGEEKEGGEKSSSGLTSMKRDKKEKKDQEARLEGPGDEDYDYGLRVDLNKESLEKLGIDALPKVGSKMKLVADVEVVGQSSSAGRDGDYKSLSLQITSMKLED